MPKNSDREKNESLLLLVLVSFIIVLLMVFLFATPSMIERAFDNQWELHELEREILLLEYSTLVEEASKGNGGQLSAPVSSLENTRIVELLHDFQNNPLITQMCKSDAEFRAIVNQTTAR